MSRGEPVIGEEAVKRLVAGGVEGLEASRVEVATVTAAPVAKSGAPQWAEFGPVVVAQGSVGSFQLLLGILAALLAVLMAVCVYLGLRLSGKLGGARSAASTAS